MRVICVKLDEETIDDLWIVMRYTKMNRSEVIREALVKYIEEFKEKNGLRLKVKKHYIEIEL